jgi:uncharacterized protein YukE
MIIGDGGISVDPAALESLASSTSRVAGSMSATRGKLAAAASAAAGCQEPAAGAFDALQSLISGAMSCLDDCAVALSRAVGGAANAYVCTDETQIPAP